MSDLRYRLARRGYLALGASLMLLVSCARSPDVDLADGVYFGGPILTMNDEQPTAEAVAVRAGRIQAIGTLDDLAPFLGSDTRRIDLQGRTLLPGFVDSHGHVQGIGLQASSANLLPPPDGNGRDIVAVQALLRDWQANNTGPLKQTDWIVGFGYDDSQLAEERHPTRDDLDAVSTEQPVLVIHQSGHLGAVNSKALELAGVTADTQDPAGGVFRRREGSSEPNGVLEEYALFALLGVMNAQLTNDINDAMARAGAELVASFGYTTAQDGRSSPDTIASLRRVAAEDGFAIDIVAYPDILTIDEVSPSLEYDGRVRVGGVKLTIDGSPQGKTAWLTEPYFVVPDGLPEDYLGYPAVDEETTLASVDKAFANDWQILVHANGDAAIDRFIAAVDAARAAHPGANNRPVLIHGQTLRADQVEPLEELGVFPSLFPMHTFYWGDWHRDSVLGPERAENISPTGWMMERGMIFGTHHDAPVALPDSMRVLSATVTRRTRSGRVLGAEHKVPVDIALKAMTLWPAWQHFEEDRKGSIETGKLADFVVLSDNPTTVPEDQLSELVILETIKEGVSVYRRP